LTTIRARFITGLALSAAVICGAPFASGAQKSESAPSDNIAPNGFPAARCSRPADQEALRVTQLVEFVEKSRRMAVRNPLLLADVGYYEAELAASRRCLRAVATG
jgi:hypothetical protein